MEQTIEERLPANKLINAGEMVIQVILDIMLIVGGIGLLNMRPWGRGLAIAYGIASIANRIPITLYQVFIVTPAMTKLMGEVMAQQPGQPNPMAGMMSSMTGFAGFLGIILMLILLVYPITVLVIMFHPVTVAVFQGKGGPPRFASQRGRPHPDDEEESSEPSTPDEHFRPRHKWEE